MANSDPVAFAKSVLKRSLFAVVGAALLLFALGEGPWAKGLALGGLASAANFYLMAMMLPRALSEGRARAQGMSLFSILIRFAVMGGALGLAIYRQDTVSVGWCAAGLFAVQLTIIGERILGRFFPAVFAGSR